MMRPLAKRTKELFERIFSDAHVIDVDFSEWDKKICLCVVGVDAEYPVPERLPLFSVEFKLVSRFHCSFRHVGIKLNDASHHCQWNIQDLNIEMTDTGFQVELTGAGASPNISLECADIEIFTLPHEMPDSLFPGWDRPYTPLARPGIEAMYREKKADKGCS